jgi:hypothetical protein
MKYSVNNDYTTYECTYDGTHIINSQLPIYYTNFDKIELTYYILPITTINITNADCNRDIIRRIWCEDMVPSDHPNFGKRDKTDKNPDKTSSQKTSETKKTLSNEIYIEMILWRKKKLNNEKLNNQLITSPRLSTYLSEKYNTNVSVDIIKNIWCGKTKLHDFNFTDCNNEMTYEEYIKIISKKE